MNSQVRYGWDVGGAHLKAALIDRDGEIRHVMQYPCPLWRGLEYLDAAVAHILASCPDSITQHAVTMTGELADIFPDRLQGVQLIAQRMAMHLGEKHTRFYAGPAGFVALSAAIDHAAGIASANWHASAACIARQIPEGLFIDIGSTTADIIPLHVKRPASRGYSDAERMRYDELVYTGAVRTPLMAVVRLLPYKGEWQSVAAEHFATMADVYRLTGQLAREYDMADTADGQGKSEQESARRLARMIGHDLADADMPQWRALASACRSQQLHRLHMAAERVLSASGIASDAPLIGAGAGYFLVEMLARQLQRPFIDAASLVPSASRHAKSIAVCFPAYAVARLAGDEAWPA